MTQSESSNSSIIEAYIDGLVREILSLFSHYHTHTPNWSIFYLFPQDNYKIKALSTYIWFTN